MSNPYYIAIDLKSFYASVECMERGLDPLATNLVVADKSRTEKTICLAVSPSLKSYGISGRARLFEVVQRVKEVNALRRQKAPGHKLIGASSFNPEVIAQPQLALDYIAATPQMALYVEYSTRIYKTYLKYIAPEDIHVYSIDEVFIDATKYLKYYNLTAEQLSLKLIREVLAETGITATVGMGTNLYLCKIAMDIVAKHAKADKNGARMAALDEKSYRQLLWNHRPLTDFWRVGPGYAKKLAQQGIYTMGDIAKCSLGGAQDYYNEELLYKLFGINAELLIDHAWGWEPCTIEEIKAYRPSTTSITAGQVLQEPYDYKKGKLIVREMIELLVLDLVKKRVVTNQLVLTVGYDVANLETPELAAAYKGPVHRNHYGKLLPQHAHGTATLEHYTSSTAELVSKMMSLYERIVDPNLLIRRVNISANRLQPATIKEKEPVEIDLFAPAPQEQKIIEQNTKKEQSIQKTILKLQDKYGKGTVLKGMNLEKGARTIERNHQIGGHKA